MAILSFQCGPGGLENNPATTSTSGACTPAERTSPTARCGSSPTPPIPSCPPCPPGPAGNPCRCRIDFARAPHRAFSDASRCGAWVLPEIRNGFAWGWGGSAPKPFSHTPSTYGSTYGPFGITAIRAAGPYSAKLSATAASTLAAGVTWHSRRISALRPSVTTFT